MARYSNTIPTPMEASALERPISDYLVKEGFNPANYKGRQVWKKGVGIMTAPQYVDIYYEGNSIRLEAFIKYALLPGCYVGEMGITGFFGALPKSLLKGRVQTIEKYIYDLFSARV